MNYQDYIKYDPEKKQYTDSYGYVIDGVSSKALPSELASAAEAIAIANAAAATVSSGNFQTVTAGYGLNNQLAITTNNVGTATLTPSGTSSNIDVIVNPKGGDGSLKVGANYTQHVALVGNNAAKVSTRYSIGATANLTLECKGATGKTIFTNETSSTQKESLELFIENGLSSFTASSVNPATYPNSDIKFIPRGLGIVDCKSGTMEWNRGIASGQVLNTGNNKVWFDNWISNSFPAGFISYVDIGGYKYDSFQNTSGRPIVLMVTGSIRETTTVAGITINLWIARSVDSSIRHGQMLLAANGSDHNDPRALNSSSILKLANNEYFSLWVNVNGTGITIGGANDVAARPMLSYRLMP